MKINNASDTLGLLTVAWTEDSATVSLLPAKSIHKVTSNSSILVRLVIFN